MNYLKIFYENAKALGTTGSVIIAAAAYWFNHNTQIVPKEYADLAMTIITLIVGIFFAGKMNK